jgi:peptidoglycan/LPS O-acetylase OafA/YrhL
MIGVALGGSFVKERGRRVLPIVIICALVFAAILGGALDFVISTFYASAMH